MKRFLTASVLALSLASTSVLAIPPMADNSPQPQDQLVYHPGAAMVITNAIQIAQYVLAAVPTSDGAKTLNANIDRQGVLVDIAISLYSDLKADEKQDLIASLAAATKLSVKESKFDGAKFVQGHGNHFGVVYVVDPREGRDVAYAYDITYHPEQQMITVKQTKMDSNVAKQLIAAKNSPDMRNAQPSLGN